MTPAQELIHLASMQLLPIGTDPGVLRTKDWRANEAESWLRLIAAGDRRLDLSIDESGVWPCLRRV